MASADIRRFQAHELLVLLKPAAGGQVIAEAANGSLLNFRSGRTPSTGLAVASGTCLPPSLCG
jgi:hypothetical protein